jgi:alpha-D-ribose 1-methylphosphonate 5-triphosphate diphosphatase PhnM
MRSLVTNPIEFCSSFISYSTKDQKSAERLHTELQNKGAPVVQRAGRTASLSPHGSFFPIEGTPNLVQGGSHSGNVSAETLA